MSDQAIITVEGLWKRYGMPLPRWMESARDKMRVLGGDDPRITDDGGPWALKDIHMELRRGENLGLIGRNGAGKSTLLKVLAGVSRPTHGRVEVKAPLFPMIELNAGLHPDLTGRENIYMLGAIMGMSRARLDDRVGDIIGFTELKEWIDRPVRKYSSGMLARLGFSVAIHADAEIILIDEVLGVGDYAFQKKCMSRISEISSSGTSIIFVSHNPYLVERICDRVALLQDGELKVISDPGTVITSYFEMGMGEASDSEKTLSMHDNRPGTGDLRITRLELLDANGEELQTVMTGQAVTFRLHYITKQEVRDANFGLRLYDAQNTFVLSMESTRSFHDKTLDGERYLDCKVSNLPLMPNAYTAQIKVAGSVLLDQVDNAKEFTVRADPEVMMDSGNKGIAYTPAQWDFYCEPTP